MLDLPRMKRITLSARPRMQRLLAYTVLMPNYHVLPGVKIELEGADNLPDEPVIFAMNHTDRYNYFPFQYRLWRETGRFTATWVKGKYYQNPALSWFMEVMNNIPTVSRGYLITRDFLSTVGRRPTDEEYGALRDAVQRAGHGEAGAAEALSGVVPDALLTRARNMLGRRFDPASEAYPHSMDQLFREMMRQFVALNVQAFEDRGLDVLVFPQGTRSKRLSKGHIGLSQVALRYGKTVVPVGCNGSDLVYPSSSPVAKAGRIVYRFGEPYTYDAAAEYHVPDFEPFTPEAEVAHRERFQAYVDTVMNRIDALLDEPYRFSADQSSGGVSGASRFV